MKAEWFVEAFNHLLEGLIIMDEHREIRYVNTQAYQMTGWKAGDSVPFCSYCQMRKIAEGEERCILAERDALPAFQAFMPTYNGLDESFEMGLSPVFFDGSKHWILVLRNPQWTSEKQHLKIKQLLVHDTMMAQEDERTRIARELHDNIGQNVFSIFLGLQSIKPHIHEEAYKLHLSKMEKGLEDTLDNIKRLSKELHPSILDHLGIERALLDAVKSWSELFDVQFSTSFDLKNRSLEPQETTLHLFRIIQEAVHNAIRHGKATHISIQLSVDHDQLHFKIEDNGIGFDIKQTKRTGLGLYHMLERIHMIGGEIKWTSEINRFTLVEGSIPLKTVDKK